MAGRDGAAAEGAWRGLAREKIECYCGPADLKAPDDLEAVMTGFIAQATKTLDIAVQELDSSPRR